MATAKNYFKNITFQNGIGRSIDPFELFGGGDDEESLNPTEMLMQQLSARGAGLPTFLQQQQEFAPKFTQLDFDLAKEFAPQFAGLDRDVTRIANPEAAQALEALGATLKSRGDLGSLNVSPEILDALRQDVRGSQASRGVLRSPLSALTEARATLDARINERDKFLNLAQGLASGIPSISPRAFSNISAVPGMNLSQMQSSANEMTFQRFNQQFQQRNQNRQLLGNALGTAGSLAMLMNPATAPIAAASMAAGGGFGGGGQGGINFAGSNVGQNFGIF